MVCKGQYIGPIAMSGDELLPRIFELKKMLSDESSVFYIAGGIKRKRRGTGPFDFRIFDPERIGPLPKLNLGTTRIQQAAALLNLEILDCALTRSPGVQIRSGNVDEWILLYESTTHIVSQVHEFGEDDCQAKTAAETT